MWNTSISIMLKLVSLRSVYPRDSICGEWSAIESHRAVAAAAAVGRDDWVILKIVDRNDAGAIIKPRSMPRQSWRVISARVPRTNAWGENRERNATGAERESFSSGFSAESEIRTSWRGKFYEIYEIDTSPRSQHRLSQYLMLNSVIGRETRADLEKFICQTDNSFMRNISVTQ